MKKTLYVTLMLFAMAAFVGGIAQAAGVMTHGKSIEKVKLSALPGTNAKDSGEADFTLGKDGMTIDYVLRGRNIEDATMAHIHAVGPGGTPGAIVAWLYPTSGEAPSLKAGKTTGVLAKGTIDTAKLEGPMKGKTVKELYEMIEQGKAGIAVHTKANPGGELFGFVKAEGHAMHKTPAAQEKTSGY